MAEVINQLNSIEKELENIKKEAEEAEKALYKIPTSISTSIELSSNINHALEQLNEIKNMRISPDLDINQVKSNFSYIKNMVSDINESAANIAINNFNTSTNEDTLKIRLNAAKQAFTTQLSSGESVIDVISSIDSVMGEQIRNEIKNIDLLTARMRNVTENGLTESTDNLGLALGKNLGVQGYIEEIEALKSNIADQKEYIAMTYPNGADGLSTQKSRLTDEFSTGASELEQYENEIKVLEQYTNRLAEAEKLLAIEQDEVNSKLKESASVGGVFTGYFDMTTLGDKAEKQLSKYSGILDLMSNPFLMQGSTEEVKEMFRDALPSFDIEPVREQVKEIKNQDDLLSDILNKQSELLNDTEYVTQRTKEWAKNEEEINKLYETRDRYVKSQLDVAEILHSMNINNKDDRLLNLSNPKENAEYESYMTNVEQAILDTKELREEIIKAQNIMNTPSNGVQSFMGTLSEEHIQKLKNAINIYENGLKANASGTDADLITSLAKYIEDVQRIAGQVENKLDSKVAVANEVLNTLRSDRAQGIKFDNDDTKENRYYQQVKTIKQIRSELENLQNNEKYILPNLNVEQLIQYRELINKLKLDLRSIEDRNAELVRVFNDRETQLPDTSKILYSNSLSKSKEINGDLINTINAIIKEASIIEKVAQAEKEAADAARIHAENEERVAEATKSIRESIKNSRQKTNKFGEIEYTEEEIKRREDALRKQLDEGLKNTKTYKRTEEKEKELRDAERIKQYNDNGLRQGIERLSNMKELSAEQARWLAVARDELYQREFLRAKEAELNELISRRNALEDEYSSRRKTKQYDLEKEELDKDIARLEQITSKKNDYLEKEKEITREKEKQLNLEKALNGDFEIDMGVEAPEGAFTKVFEEKEKENNKANKEIEAADEKLKNDITNKVSAVLSAIKSAVNNVISLVRKVNEIFNKTVVAIVGAFQKAVSLIGRILQLFGSLSDRVRNNTNSVNILKGSFTELKSAVDLVVGAFNKLINNQFLQKGKELLSSIQSLNMIIGTELTQSTIEWATNLENTFGLSAAELITNLKQVDAVLYGLGMNSKDVFNAGRNLETVGLQISSLTGYDYETVIRKLGSGLKGMTQSVDDLGISVRETQMNAFLKKLKSQGGEYANISTSFSALNEQQRIYVRYAAIMDQITSKKAYSLENYAKSLDTITGRMSILKSQINALKSAIGVLALKLLNKIIMPLTYIIYLARQAVKSIAELLDIDLNLSAGMNGGDTSEIDDTTDALDEMNEAAKDAKGSLDSLDHVSTMSNSGKNDDNFDYSKLLDLTSNYSDMLADMNKMNDDYIEKCKQKLLEMLAWMKQKITDWVQEWTGRLIDWDVIKSNLIGAWTNIKDMFKNMQSIARTTFGIISGLLYSVFDDLDLSRLLFKFTKVLERLTKFIDVVLKKVAKPIQNMYDKYISPYVVRIGNKLEAWFDKLIFKFNDLISIWEDPQHQGAVNKFFDNLGKKIQGVIMIFEALFSGSDRKMSLNEVGLLDEEGMGGFKKAYEYAGKLHDTVKQLIVVFKDLFGIKNSLDDVMTKNEMSDTMLNFRGILLDVRDILLDVLTNIVDFNGDGSFTFDDIRLAIETIKEKLEDIRKWLDENKESITNILSAVWDTIVKIGETKFTIIKDLIQFIVDNEATVVKVLETIQKVLDFVIAHPVISAEIAVGVQLAGTALKTVGSALIWKKILGLGAGGAAVNAAASGGSTIGSAIAYNIISKVKNGLSALHSILAGGAAVGQVVGWAVAAKEGVELAVDGIKDAYNDTKNVIDGFFNNNGEMQKASSYNIRQWAYDMRSALEQVYGKDIPTDGYEIALNKIISDLRSTGYYTEQELETIRQNIENQYNEIGSIDLLDKMAYETENSKNVISGLVNELENKTTELRNTSITNTSGIRSSFVGMSNQINVSCRSSLSFINTLISAINRLNNMSVHKITQQTSGWASNKGKVSIGTIRGFANGGSPKSGSIFMANENGNTELVGNFGGYSGVANQDMIIGAMQNAIVSALKSSGANNSSISNYNFEICKSGMFVGDDSTVRKLANMINSTNISNRNNIANVGFSM